MMEQGTEEWFKARLGIPTASQYSKLIGSQGKASTQAQGYINELIAQRLTGELPEQITNKWIERGNELEPFAREWFELETDLEVQEHGLILHPEHKTGCSPDGLIGSESGLEIKCLAPNNHVSCIRAGKLPAAYKQQVMGSMWVTGRSSWWFVSYHPDLPKLCIEVKRDDEYIALLAAEVIKATEIIETEISKLEKMK